MRIVALSDTHGYHKQLQVPDGDLLIHAGDFSMRAKSHHVIEFAQWFKSLPHQHKIIIPGNHDAACENRGAWASELFSPAIYLEHATREVMGYTIFGSAYSSSLQEPSDWFFDYPRYSACSKTLWDRIPENVDILVTHAPPHGIMDLVPHPRFGEDPHVGDENLLERVKKVQPRIHIFGHIHEGYGVYRPDYVDMFGHEDPKDFNVGFYNVCVCDGNYKPINPITVIDL